MRQDQERSDVGVQYPAHLLAVNSDTERIQRFVRAAPRPEPVRDRVQQLDHRPLDDLVLQGGDSERTLLAIRFRNVDPSRRQCPISSPLDPVVQVPETALLSVRPERNFPAPGAGTGRSVLAYQII
jgi:hypothetical protein